MLCGDILGSVLNATSCQASSTVMAYWPFRHGNISNIDYCRLHVGCIQYYCKHHLTISDAAGESTSLLHYFAYVRWYERHDHDSWSFATVCTNTFETASIFYFIFIQQIFAVGAYCQTEVSFSGIDEIVFVSAPVPMRLSF